MQKPVSDAQLRIDFKSDIHTSSYHSSSEWYKVATGYILEASRSQGPTTARINLSTKHVQATDLRFHPGESLWYGNRKIITDEQVNNAFSAKGGYVMPRWTKTVKQWTEPLGTPQRAVPNADDGTPYPLSTPSLSSYGDPGAPPPFDDGTSDLDSDAREEDFRSFVTGKFTKLIDNLESQFDEALQTAHDRLIEAEMQKWKRLKDSPEALREF